MPKIIEEWDYREFGTWLRQAKTRRLPKVTQLAIAEALGVPQQKVSRWESETPNTDAPTLAQLGALADLFDADFIDLAKLCGRWNDEIERRVLVSLASARVDPSALSSTHYEFDHAA